MHLRKQIVRRATGFEQGDLDTPGTRGGDNATARLDLINEPQPDLLLMIDPARGGQARISEDGYVENAPELVAEITSSSASHDLHDKLNTYRRNGVREYIVWRVLDEELDWLILRGHQYEQNQPGANNILRSETFPGLWLDRSALLAGNMSGVLAILQDGLASGEHAQFVERLARTKDSD